MPKTLYWLPVALLSVALLAGCESNPFLQADPRPVPPVEPGSACVSNCELAKTQCDQRQQLREQLCQEYAAQLKGEQRDCRGGNGPLCVQPIECLGVDTSLCITRHEECLMECANAPPPPAAPAAPTGEAELETAPEPAMK